MATKSLLGDFLETWTTGAPVSLKPEKQGAIVCTTVLGQAMVYFCSGTDAENNAK